MEYRIILDTYVFFFSFKQNTTEMCSSVKRFMASYISANMWRHTCFRTPITRKCKHFDRLYLGCFLFKWKQMKYTRYKNIACMSIIFQYFTEDGPNRFFHATSLSLFLIILNSNIWYLWLWWRKWTDT